MSSKKEILSLQNQGTVFSLCFLRYLTEATLHFVVAIWTWYMLARSIMTVRKAPGLLLKMTVSYCQGRCLKRGGPSMLENK